MGMGGSVRGALLGGGVSVLPPGYPRAGTWRGAARASSAAASLMNKGAMVSVLMPPHTPGGGFGATFPRAGRGAWAGL